MTATIETERLAELPALIAEVESRHRLLGRPGFVSASGPFLRDLQKELGVSSVTEAYAVWVSANKFRERLAERYRRDAEISFWYSVDPFTLTAEQRAGLLANLETVKAQKRLNEGNFDPTNFDGVYDLVKLATGCDEQAARARGDAIEKYMEQRKAD